MNAETLRARLHAVLFGGPEEAAEQDGELTRERILERLRQVEAAHAASASAAPVPSASPDRDGGGK